MTKGSIPHENILILDAHAPNQQGFRTINVKIDTTEKKQYFIIVGDFNSPLSNQEQ